MVYCGDKFYNSFEELGHAILKSLPKEKQRVKWWRLHKPWTCGHTNCMVKGFQKILEWLPHFTTSRSWVGYFWIHLYLFNKWCILFTFGHWDKYDTNRA